jgi:DNA (cytosine-5)-methyltransferase 1
VTPRIGSLFSGGGGLDRAVEVDPAASKVLAHRWPGVPNLGDITKVDWASMGGDANGSRADVDIICGGFP